jgi:prophage regulatory protein
MQERLLRPRQVQDLLAISKPTLYRLIRDGKLPKPEKLGPRTSVWRESVISKAVDNLLLQNAKA